MLETKDIQLLQNMIEQAVASQIKEAFGLQEQKLNKTLDDRFALQDDKLNKTLDDRFALQEEKFNKILDQRIVQSERLVLEELDRVEVGLNRRMDRIQNNLDELNQFYRILMLERGNSDLLVKRVDSLEERIDRLERTIA